MNWFQRLFHRRFLIRLFNWEYWSFNAIYIWLFPFWLFLSLRARSFFFFAASNPGLKNGGFLNESKRDIHELIPEHLYPKTRHFSLPANADMVIRELEDNGFSFPLIAKPDIGGRGRGVKVLMDDDDVRKFLKKCFVDFHIQEYVAFKNEVGIFYYRYPGSSSGHISGIVRKEFLSVTGDGIQTIRQLLEQDSRAIMYLSSLEQYQQNDFETILAKGEKRVVSPYGNHARGSKFLDHSHLIDEKLTAFVDKISKEIDEFYFGRFDIRYRDWQELKQGKNFAIIEVNGAGAEPTHMYDPRHSIFFAWKEILRHWILLGRISRMNHKKGHRYLTLGEGMKMFREDKLHAQKLAAMKF